MKRIIGITAILITCGSVAYAQDKKSQEVYPLVATSMRDAVIARMPDGKRCDDLNWPKSDEACGKLVQAIGILMMQAAKEADTSFPVIISGSQINSSDRKPTEPEWSLFTFSDKAREGECPSRTELKWDAHDGNPSKPVAAEYIAIPNHAHCYAVQP